jgi:hypothetical protein
VSYEERQRAMKHFLTTTRNKNNSTNGSSRSALFTTYIAALGLNFSKKYNNNKRKYE